MVVTPSLNTNTNLLFHWKTKAFLSVDLLYQHILPCKLLDMKATEEANHLIFFPYIFVSFALCEVAYSLNSACIALLFISIDSVYLKF